MAARADMSRMARKSNGAKSKGTKDDVIDVEVVDDSEPAHSKPGARPAKLGIGTVARPCLIGVAILTVVGAVLPH